MNSNIIIWNRSGCLSREAILALLGKTISPADKYLIEKHLEDCSLCKDAVEGFSMLPVERVREIFQAEDDSLQGEKVERKPLSGKIWISLAAAVILAITGIFTLNKNLIKTTNEPIVQEIMEEPKISSLPETKSKQKILRKNPSTTVQGEKVEANEDRKFEVQTEEPLIASESSSEMLADVPSQGKEEQKSSHQEDVVIGYGTKSAAKAMRSEPTAGQNVEFKEKSIAVEKKNNSETTFYVVDDPAKFQGGDIDKFRDYIESRLNIAAGKNEISTGRLTVNFTLDNNGVIKDIFVIKGLDDKTDSTAIMLIKNAPKWQPARQGGMAVNVNMVLSLKIQNP